MNKRHHVLAILLFSFGCECIATDFETIARVGLDTNPLELSNDFIVQQQEFAHAGFYSKSHWGDWFNWDVKTEKALYFDDSRIDWFESAAAISIQNDFTVFEVPFEYGLGVNYSKRDETYVDKESGFVASYQATSISDRFDHEQTGYYLNLSHPLRHDTDLYLEYTDQSKNYHDYQLVGLDNLDNIEATSTFGVNFAPRETGSFFLRINHAKRNYDVRQDRDLDGVLIADTLLVFNDYSVAIGYHYNPEKTTDWTYRFSYINRSTNGTQYYDSQRAQISIKGQFYWSDYQLFTTQLEYRTFFYDEDSQHPMSLFEKEDYERQGAVITVEYNLIFATLFSTNLSFYTNLQYSQFTSSNDFYAYDGSQASAGIRWALD